MSVTNAKTILPYQEGNIVHPPLQLEIQHSNDKLNDALQLCNVHCATRVHC